MKTGVRQICSEGEDEPSDWRGPPSAAEASMGRDQIIAAEPIPATELIPEDLLRRFREFDGIEFGREQELLGSGERRSASEADGSAGAERDVPGHRPPWLAQTFLPRMAPPPISSAALRAIADRSLPPALVSQLLRQELLDQSYPWSTIGRVFVGTDPTVNDSNWLRLFTSSGSGAMVGPNLMVTASHIAPWGRSPWWMHFVPAYRDGRRPFGGSFVERFRGVRVDPNTVGGEDVVICKLYRPLGQLTGWLARWRWFDEARYKDWPHISVGYPGNMAGAEKPILEPFAAIDDVDTDGNGLELETHPFTSDGWSGGPLFFWRNGTPWAVGVCSGREDEFDLWELFTKKHSVFSGGRRFTDLIDFGEQNWS